MGTIESASKDQKRVRWIIHGRVQGVFFRASTRKEALNLLVKGWVRNLQDGSVEVVAEASADTLTLLKQWCQKGPPRAKVLRLEEFDFFEEISLEDFQIR